MNKRMHESRRNYLAACSVMDRRCGRHSCIAEGNDLRINPHTCDHCARMDQVHAFQAQGHGKCDRDDGLIYPLDCGVALMSREIGLGSKSSVTYGIGDTGATDHLHDSTQNPMLYDTMPATARYQTAGEGTITGDLKGKMDITVLNLDHQPQGPPSVDHTLTATTVKGLGPSLFSLEQEFRDNGYDIHLTHGYRRGDFTGMYRPPESGKPESFIPMVYNHEGSGGWRVPYLIRKPGTTDAEHQATLSAVMAQHELDSALSARVAAKQHELTVSQAKLLEEYYWACPAVSQTATVRVPGERNIRPAFTYGGLRRYKAKNWHEFHSAMAHFGEPGKPCVVCDMFKGVARRMPKHTEGRPRETRPGAKWHMDMITFRHRSEEGSKYLIVLTDEATQFYQLIPLHGRVMLCMN